MILLKVLQNFEIHLFKYFFLHIQKHSSKVFYKKAVIKNFAILTGKHLCWSLFLIKLEAWNKKHKRFFFFKLEYLFCQRRKDTIFGFEWTCDSFMKTSVIVFLGYFVNKL